MKSLWGDPFPFQAQEARKRVGQIGKVVLVGSGKGGVGKSLVACGLALGLADEGLATGILDIDIHGASLPNYLGVYPPLRSGKDGLEPKRVGDLKVMSVALFTGNNPVPIRGEQKQNLIAQLLSLTNWGKLDFLVVDLPPSMGDEVLTAFSLFAEKGTLVLVTTPSPNAVSIVSRLRQLADREKVPLQGIVLNMAYITNNGEKNYPFGKADRRSLERRLGSTIMAEIPLEPRVSTAGLRLVMRGQNELSKAFRELTKPFLGN